MRSLQYVLILVVAVAASAVFGEEGAAVHVFDFEEDRDFNGQPDLWRRVISSEYPAYLEGGLTDKTAHSGTHSLAFFQNGGNLLYRSPPMEISPLHDYELEAWVKTEGLGRSEVRVRIIWLNVFKRELGSTATEPVVGSTDWTKVRLFADSIPKGTSLAVIECLMEGRDIRGSAWFDSIRLAEHPKLTIGLGTRGNLIPPGVPRVALGKITGLPGPSTRIALELRDYLGRSAWQRTEAIRPMTDSYEFAWGLPSELYGFYTANCSVAPEGGPVLDVRVSVTFPPPIFIERMGREPVLGIDLPKPQVWAGERLGMLGSLGTALRMEIDNSDVDKAKEVQRLLWLLAKEKSFPVAVIPMRMIIDGGEDAVKWALIEYGDLVGAWQVGVHGESAEGDADVVKTLGVLRELTHPTPVGMLEELAEELVSFSPDFVVVRPAKGADADGISAELARATSRWGRVWIELPGDLADDLQRLSETTLRCVREGVERIMLLPSGDGPALFDDELSPTASYLVWRNFNSLFSGSKYAGELRLPEGSENVVFRNEKELVLACWSDGLRQVEATNLGDEVKFWDIFGRRRFFPGVGGKSLIQTGELPVFATGLNRTIMEMTLSARLLTETLYMEAGLQRQGLSVANRLGDNLECVLDLRYPPGFSPEHRRYVFDLGPDEEYVGEAPVSVPRDAVPGKQMLYATLAVSGRESLFLEIFKEFEVVSEIEMNTRVRREGEFVEISQEVINHADAAVDLVGLAGVPGELPQQSLPATVEPGGMIVRSYRFPIEKVDGKRIWVAVREMNGTRFINRYIDIDDEND